MAEAIATEGVDVGEEESDEADLVAIEVKGSIKTDEVKALHFSRHSCNESYKCDRGKKEISGKWLKRGNSVIINRRRRIRWRP